jgi:hypothetical protein
MTGVKVANPPRSTGYALLRVFPDGMCGLGCFFSAIVLKIKQLSQCVNFLYQVNPY